MNTAERAARAIFADEMDANTVSDVTRIAVIIAAEYEPVMEVLREAVEAGNHSDDCAAVYRDVECDCWVSRAQKILEGK